MLESQLLAGVLGCRAVTGRIRAGYVRIMRANGLHIVSFWEHVARDKGFMGDLLQADPHEWQAAMHAYTRTKNAIDHHIEHWICVYWDERQAQWRLLDANDVFLKAHSDIDIGFHLP